MEVDTLTSPPNWASIASDINTWLGQLWAACATASDTLTDITVTDENYPGSTHGQGVHAVGIPGARPLTDSSLSVALCAVGSFKTAVARRYARGHMFFPPAMVSGAAGSNGTWSQTNPYWTACQAFLSSYAAGHTVGSTSYVAEIFSRTKVAEAA